MKTRVDTYSYLLIPVLLALAGAACRFHFREIETRYQILTFWFVAVIVEMGARLVGITASWSRLIISAVFIASAMIVVKLHFEGLPSIPIKLL